MQRLWLFSAFVCVFLFTSHSVAHEPIFGVGPHTIYQGGFGAEVEVEYQKGELGTIFEVVYGITPDLALTAHVPVLLIDGQYFGLGDSDLRLKWRFFRKDSLGAQQQVAVVVGGRIPTGSLAEDLSSESKRAGLSAALTYGYEGRRFYWWVDGRYNIASPISAWRLGHKVFYDAAFGIRPWRLSYYKPDLVVLVEANGEERWQQDNRGRVISVGPGFLFSYRNIMLKGGVSIPVYTNLPDREDALAIRYIFGLEGHF